MAYKMGEGKDPKPCRSGRCVEVKEVVNVDGTRTGPYRTCICQGPCGKTLPLTKEHFGYSAKEGHPAVCKACQKIERDAKRDTNGLGRGVKSIIRLAESEIERDKLNIIKNQALIKGIKEFARKTK